MVEFDKKNHTFKITIHGGEAEYFNFLRALARMTASLDEESMDKEAIYYTNTLLEEMLPSKGEGL